MTLCFSVSWVLKDVIAIADIRSSLNAGEISEKSSRFDIKRSSQDTTASGAADASLMVPIKGLIDWPVTNKRFPVTSQHP